MVLIDSDTMHRLSTGSLLRPATVCVMDAAAPRAERQAVEAMGREMAERRTSRTSRLAQPQGGATLAYRELRTETGPRLALMRLDDGKIESRPDAIDDANHKRWDRYYQDDTPPRTRKERAATFKPDDYDCRHTAPPADIPASQAQHVADAARKAPSSAADNASLWPADFRVISTTPAWWMARLFRRVESGTPWPRRMRWAMLQPALKPHGEPMNPLSHRDLALLAAPYRLWGRMRLAQLQIWALTWDDEAIYSGP